MAPRKQSDDPLRELIQKSLIVQLGLARIPQQQIRKIVGCDINTVNAVVKHLRVRDRADK